MASANTFGGRALRDPADLLRECASRNLPYQHWHGRATVAAFPAGRRWGTAEFLMLRGDLQKLDLTADHDLILSDFRRTLTAKRLSVLTAEEVLPGLAADAAAVYLVTAADRRYHLDRSPFSKAYNVPDGAGGLVTATTNAGTPWTWATLFADLWGLLPTAAGPVPALPFAPGGRPEGWRFWGHPSAWQALCDVLDRLCCTIVLDPTTDTFTVERLGAADAAATAFETAHATEIQWDGRPFTPKRASRPEKVSVRFRRSPVPTDGSDPFYSVSVTLTAQTGTVAGTTVLLADDLTALGATGTPTNAAALATRAAERAADYERAQVPAEGARAKSWRGLRPDAAALPGAGYGAVSWDDRGTGWATGAGGGGVPADAPGLGERWPASTGSGIDAWNRNSVDDSDLDEITPTVSRVYAYTLDGLCWEDFPTTGFVNLRAYPADPTQQGMVSTEFQQFGGGKQFLNSMFVGLDTGVTDPDTAFSGSGTGTGVWVSNGGAVVGGDLTSAGTTLSGDPFGYHNDLFSAFSTGFWSWSDFGFCNIGYNIGPANVMEADGLTYIARTTDDNTAGGTETGQRGLRAVSRFTGGPPTIFPLEPRYYSNSIQAYGDITTIGYTTSGAVRQSILLQDLSDYATPRIGTQYQQPIIDPGYGAMPVYGTGSLDYYWIPDDLDIFKFLFKPEYWGPGTYTHANMRLVRPTAIGAYRVMTGTVGNVGAPGTAVDQEGGSATTGGLTFAGGLYISGSVTLPPVGTGDITDLAAGVAAWLLDPTSAKLAAAVTDETGTGAAVFANAPTLVDPVVGTQSAGDNSTKAASTAYVATAIATAVSGLMEIKGGTDCSGNPNFPAASKGDAYYVTVAGKIGGGSGVSVDVGDVYVASADNAGGTQAAVGTSWFVLEHNLAGALLSANNLSDLASASAARTNLGVPAGSGTSTGTNTGDQTITLTGDVTGSGTASVAATLANTAVTPGSYTHASITVDAKGRITAASSGSVTSGTVTSVAMSVPSTFSVSGSPITSSGTLVLGWNSQNANLIFAGPNTGSPAAPSFRAMVAADLPDVSASQSDQESGSSNTVYITPGRQQYHHSACKAWAYFTVSGTTVTVARSYNVSSITRGSTGNYTITFDVDFSDAHYSLLVTCDNKSGTGNLTIGPYSRAAGTCNLSITLGSGTATDPSGCSFAAFGDQ